MKEKFAKRKSQFYRTRLCEWFLNGHCSHGRHCNWAHSEAQMRDRVDLSRTMMCPELSSKNGCTRPNCRFAHKYRELRATTDVYKTSLCTFWLQGKCAAGNDCRFAHGSKELNVVDKSDSSRNMAVPGIVFTESSRSFSTHKGQADSRRRKRREYQNQGSAATQKVLYSGRQIALAGDALEGKDESKHILKKNVPFIEDGTAKCSAETSPCGSAISVSLSSLGLSSPSSFAQTPKTKTPQFFREDRMNPNDEHCLAAISTCHSTFLLSPVPSTPPRFPVNTEESDSAVSSPFVASTSLASPRKLDVSDDDLDVVLDESVITSVRDPHSQCEKLHSAILPAPQLPTCMQHPVLNFPIFTSISVQHDQNSVGRARLPTHTASTKSLVALSRSPKKVTIPAPPAESLASNTEAAEETKGYQSQLTLPSSRGPVAHRAQNQLPQSAALLSGITHPRPPLFQPRMPSSTPPPPLTEKGQIRASTDFITSPLSAKWFIEDSCITNRQSSKVADRRRNMRSFKAQQPEWGLTSTNPHNPIGSDGVVTTYEPLEGIGNHFHNSDNPMQIAALSFASPSSTPSTLSSPKGSPLSSGITFARNSSSSTLQITKRGYHEKVICELFPDCAAQTDTSANESDPPTEETQNTISANESAQDSPIKPLSPASAKEYNVPCRAVPTASLIPAALFPLTPFASPFISNLAMSFFPTITAEELQAAQENLCYED